MLFIGGPLLDMVLLVEEETRRQYGLKRDDCILANEEHNTLFQGLFHNMKSRLAAGGSAQNAARIAKWSLEEKGEVGIAGQYGNLQSWQKLFLNRLVIILKWFRS
ncbi:hypothetical protein AVEN_35973-1 [Araneus ventricosus]|uniref:Adenosine kinase n=1 Tax=Araneus ventricosus TaxID=182803 RepID=A0A4Y2NZI7_ARAVE|nr:hypothetical protein AVEN_35973-1 [Araneus ventricosus]